MSENLTTKIRKWTSIILGSGLLLGGIEVWNYYSIKWHYEALEKAVSREVVRREAELFINSNLNKYNPLAWSSIKSSRDYLKKSYRSKQIEEGLIN